MKNLNFKKELNWTVILIQIERIYPNANVQYCMCNPAIALPKHAPPASLTWPPLSAGRTHSGVARYWLTGDHAICVDTLKERNHRKCQRQSAFQTCNPNLHKAQCASNYW